MPLIVCFFTMAYSLVWSIISTFLNIVKNPLRLEKFKQYYGILSSIIGQDAQTMQKAIFEFEIVIVFSSDGNP